MSAGAAAGEARQMRRAAILSAPIAVSEAEAAALVSVSIVHFREAVRAGTMPAPRNLNGRKVYLVSELEAAIRTLPAWQGAARAGLDDGWGDDAP